MIGRRSCVLVSIALGAVLFGPISGHAAGARSTRSIAVTSTNFTTVFPTRLPSGTIRLRLSTPASRNLTSVNLAKLNPGVPMAEVSGLMRAGKLFPLLSLVQFIGGVDSVRGSTRTGLFDLVPGTYVAFSLDQLTATHNPSSPSTFFTVTGAGAGGPPPHSIATVVAVDFKFRGPTSLPSGFDTIKFVNHGHAPHEMVVLGLPPGKSLHDVKMALMLSHNGLPPPWVRSVGGWGVVGPGQAMWARVTLTPGNYILICFVPDTIPLPGHKPTGKLHFMLGMIREIRVR